MKKVLVVIRGVPGSGKSTLARKLVELANLKGESVAGPFEADLYMVDASGEYRFDPKRLGYCHNQCLADVEGAMVAGKETIIQSNTNTMFKEMAPYLTLAERYGYEVQTIIVQGDFGSVHGVPTDKLAQMKARFQFVP